MRGSCAGLAGVSLARSMLCLWGLCFYKKNRPGNLSPRPSGLSR